MFTMLEQVTELNSTIMANRYHKFEDLTPLETRGMPPAVWAEIVVYREVEVDLRAIKG